MAAVFISYSSRDRSLVETIVEQLRGAGLKSLFVAHEPESLRAGEVWEQVLYTNVRRAEAVVVIVTAATAESSWCLLEVGLARAFSHKVLPLRAESKADMPLLSDAQWTDYSDPKWLDRILRGLAAAGIDATADPVDPDRPYPGLMPFRREDAGVFFARERETSELVEMLAPQPGDPRGTVVAVVGPSGSGKSSLVHAGLLPRLARDAGRWIVIPTVVPDTDPVRALAVALNAALDDLGRSGCIATVHRSLLDRPRSIADHVDELAEASRKRNGSDPDVLLVVDQAETLFAREQDPVDQDRFLTLLELICRAVARVCVVVTIRPEFLGASERLAALCVARKMIEPIDEARLHEVIEGPAQHVGLTFDDGLVARMIKETRSGGALPLLAHILSALASDDVLRGDRQVRTSKYNELGGVLGSLGKHAGEVTKGLRPGLGGVVLPTMLRFVQLSDQDEPAARPVDYDSLEPASQEVVDAFVAGRLLITDNGGDLGTTTIRLAHESLLRHWDELNQEIQRDIDGLRLHAELRRLTAAWESHGRNDEYLVTGNRLAGIRALMTAGSDRSVRLDFTTPEKEFVQHSRTREDQRSAGRRRWLVVGAIAAVILLIVGTLAVNRSIAAGQERAAAASRALASAADDAAAGDPAAAAMLALAAYRQSPTTEAEQALFGQYVADRRLDAVFSGAPGNLRLAQVSSDGRVVAGLTVGGLLTVWTRPPSGQVQERQTTPDLEADSFGLSADGSTVWLVRQAGLTRYDVATGATRVIAPLSSPDLTTSEIQVSADGSELVWPVGLVEDDRPSLRVRDAATGRVLGDLLPPPGQVFGDFGFGPERSVVVQADDVTGTTPETVERWRPGEPTPPAVLAAGIRDWALVNGSDRLVTCRERPPIAAGDPSSSTIQAVRVDDGAPITTLTSTTRCTGLATDAQGRAAGTLDVVGSASLGEDSTSADLASGATTPFSSPVHDALDDLSTSTTVLPELVPGSEGLDAVVMNGNGVALVPLPSRTSAPSDVVLNTLSADGRTEVSVSDDGATLAVSPAPGPGPVIATAPRPATDIGRGASWRSGSRDLAIDQGGSLVADRVATDRVVVRRLPDLRPVAEITTVPVGTIDDMSDREAHFVDFDAAGHLVVGVGTDVTVWAPAEGRMLAHVDLAASGVVRPGDSPAVRLGPDPSQLIVVAPNRPDVHFVSLATGQEVGRLAVGGDLLDATVDGTGRYLAVLRNGGIAEVWDARDGTRRTGPVSVVPAGLPADHGSFEIGFIDDSGDLMIGAGTRIRVYDVGSPAPVRTLDLGAPGEEIRAQSGDGQTVIARPAGGDGDGDGLTLSLRPQDWRDELCRVIGIRTFTAGERDGLPAALPDGPMCTGA